MDPPTEIAIVGDLTDHENDLTQALLELETGAPCTLIFNSPGGSPYTALSLATLVRLRQLDATAIVTGECSSSALWPFAACRRRYVTPFSTFLFHPMKWQSEEHVGRTEATEWARHFGQLEGDMDQFLADLFEVSHELIESWTSPHRYVSGTEMAEAKLAELYDPRDPASFPKVRPGRPPRLPRRRGRG